MSAAPTMAEVANQACYLFERMMMLQELARLAIENLPNSTDSDIPLALLNGMKDMLVNDAAKAYQLSESTAKMNDLVATIAREQTAFGAGEVPA